MNKNILFLAVLTGISLTAQASDNNPAQPSKFAQFATAATKATQAWVKQNLAPTGPARASGNPYTTPGVVASPAATTAATPSRWLPATSAWIKKQPQNRFTGNVTTNCWITSQQGKK